MYITIIDLEKYMGIEAISVGNKLSLIKDLNNKYDDEAIKVIGNTGATYGYVANSVNDVIRGCHSAGYIYNSFDSTIDCEILFIGKDNAIAKIDC